MALTKKLCLSPPLFNHLNFTISAEAIYNYIYNSEESKSLELYKLLPQRRFIRIKHGSRRKKITISARQSIHTRDSIADDKRKWVILKEI